jgi:ribosomal protein L37AE/L43A
MPESRKGISEIEGKAARVAARERGKRTSFKIGCCNFCKRLFLKAAWRWVDRNQKKLYDLQSKKNQSIHFMPSLIRKLFHKSEAPKDGLTQPQREAIVDLLNYCMYADNLVFLAEDRLIADTVAKFSWDPKVPFDQFDARSTSNARNARESQVYRDQFLASIRDRLDTAAVKEKALDLCQELFLADGARSDEEDAVLQNLRQLLE